MRFVESPSHSISGYHQDRKHFRYLVKDLYKLGRSDHVERQCIGLNQRLKWLQNTKIIRDNFASLEKLLSEVTLNKIEEFSQNNFKFQYYGFLGNLSLLPYHI